MRGLVSPQVGRGRDLDVAFDVSDFGWGAKLMTPLVLEARGPWTPEEAAHHITWKEMRAVRYAIESFLPHLAGRRTTRASITSFTPRSARRP